MNSLEAPSPLATFASPSPATDPFALRYGKPLPAELRLQAAEMSWPSFVRSYCPAGGPIRLGSWSEEKLGAGRSTFKATIGLGASIHNATAIAFGPIAALTSMLYDAGFPLEILTFHQQAIGDRTATFVRCEHEGRSHWSAGIADSPTESELRAIIAGANLLHG